MINFIYEIDNETYWNDGLRLAVKLLEQDFEVNYCNLALGGDKKIRIDKPILYWGSFINPIIKQIIYLQVPKVMLFSGGNPRVAMAHQFDVIFIEDDWALSEFRDMGINAKYAFGINSQLFKPMKLNKVWDCIYPAAFALWKRHDVFVDYCKKNNKKGLAVGYMQPNEVEKECYEVCLDNGIDVMPRVTPDVLAYLINMSKEVVVPSDLLGGGQRTMWEAQACKVPVNKELLNDRLKSVYSKHYLTETQYYNLIKKQLCKLIKK